MLNELSIATNSNRSLAAADDRRTNGFANASASSNTNAVRNAEQQQIPQPPMPRRTLRPALKKHQRTHRPRRRRMRRSRWMYTGSPTAAKPARNHGARNPISLPSRTQRTDTRSTPHPAACPSPAGDSPSPPHESRSRICCRCASIFLRYSPFTYSGITSSRWSVSISTRIDGPAAPAESPSDRARETAPPRCHEIAAAQSSSQSPLATHKNPRSPARSPRRRRNS